LSRKMLPVRTVLAMSKSLYVKQNHMGCRLLRLNIDKCKTVSYYLKHPPQDTQHHIIDGNTTHILEKLNSINDLGVIFNSNLTFKDHMAQKINKAYRVLGIIKRNFIHMDESSFILLYKSMVRPHLEYANSVWFQPSSADNIAHE